MKNKIFSIFLALCIIFPIALTACGDNNGNTTPPTHTCTPATEWSSDDTHHWHACTDTTCTIVSDKAEHEFTTTTIDPTLDADGKTTKTCSICSKVIETTIPKLTQTKNEQIAVLANAVKSENYSGEIQETLIYKSNVDSTYSSKSETETEEKDIVARKSDGTTVYYSLNYQKPASYLDDEYIDTAYYIELIQENNIRYILSEDNHNNPTTTDIVNKNYVGNNYAQSFVLDKINTNLDYLLKINNEATMESTLKATLCSYMPMYQNVVFKPWGDLFTYDEDDIEITSDIAYSNGIYTATGTIVLDELEHSNAEAYKMAKSFKVEFEVVYSNNLVLKNYSKFIYYVDETPSNTEDALTELYIINDFSYSKTAQNEPFEKIKAIIDDSDYNKAIAPNSETLKFYVNGHIYSQLGVTYNTAINQTVDYVVANLATSYDEYSNIEVYLDENYTVPYVKTTDVIITDYYGANVYIKMTADENYSVVITNHIIYNETYSFEITRTITISIVTKNGGAYNISLDGLNPSGSGTVPYTDKIVINGTEADTSITTITVSEDEYIIDLYIYI